MTANLYRTFDQVSSGKIVLSLLLLGAIGCGGDRLCQVRGKVTYKDGRPIDPLAGGLVVFEPAGTDGPKASARGEIQQDGSFRLGTLREGDGAYPGKYRVLVMPPTPPVQAKEIRLPAVIHPRYQNLQDTPLEFTVVAGSNEFALPVEKP